MSNDERIAALRQLTQDYVLYGDVELALSCYNDWVVSNRVVWPYPGSRLQQPTWVTHNFDTIDLLNELMKLDSKRPNLHGRPSMNDVLGAPPSE